MNRHLLMLRVTVKDGERAFVTRDGRFEQVLEPGRHKLFDPARRVAGSNPAPALRFSLLS